MNTAFLLMAQYEARAIIPLEDVRRDFFSHLTIDQFKRKLSSAVIKLPIIRMDAGQKAALGVHIAALAEFIDQKQAAAKRELLALS